MCPAGSDRVYEEPRMRGSWTFSRRLALGFAAIVMAFAIVAVTGLRTTQTLAATAERVLHTQAVRAQLDTLLAPRIGAETSERGLVITAADRFLETCRAGLASLDTTVTALRRLTADTPSQQRRLDELRPLLDQRRGEFDRVMRGAVASTVMATEAGAAQTLQTSSQLTSLSTSLTRLVQA